MKPQVEDPGVVEQAFGIAPDWARAEPDAPTPNKLPSSKEPILDEILDFMVLLLNTGLLELRCPATLDMPRC